MQCTIYPARGNPKYQGDEPESPSDKYQLPITSILLANLEFAITYCILPCTACRTSCASHLLESVTGYLAIIFLESLKCCFVGPPSDGVECVLCPFLLVDDIVFQLPI
jgi:hypothetical protein